MNEVRLIDANALKEEINKKNVVGRFNTLLLIDEAPTVEEKPQGEWIYDNKLNNWKCSVCLETPKTIGYVGNRDFMNEHFKYCNHCGAIMANSAK